MLASDLLALRLVPRVLFVLILFLSLGSQFWKFKLHFSVFQNLDTESGSSRLRLSSLLPLTMFRLFRSSLLCDSLSVRGLC